jgi:hypothetical protein
MALANLLSSIFSRSLSLGMPALLGAAVFAGTACEAQPDSSIEDPICIDSVCDGTPPPISGSAIVDCWVSPGEGFDTLDCRYEPPIGYPILLDGATVRGRSASGDQFSGNIATDQNGRILSMAKLDPGAYPYELNLDIRFDSTNQNIIALDGVDKVTTRVIINSAEELGAERPASAFIPFDLWEVNLLGRDSDFSAMSFGYEIDLGNNLSHTVGFKTRPLLFGQIESFYLPVDVNNWSVEAIIAFEGGESGTATLTGPGNYAVKGGELLFAEAEDFPQEIAGGSAIASCWLETTGHGFEELYCRAHPGQGMKMDGALIEVISAHGDSVRKEVGDSAVHIATISPRAFPARVSMVAQIAQGVVGLQGLAGRSLRSSMIIDSKSLPRIGSRQNVQAPYSIWQVTVDNQSEGFQGLLDSYVLELGEGMYDRFAALIDDAQTPFVADSSVTVFSVATPVGVRSISGSGFILVGGVAQEIDFDLRPGTLVVGN